MVDALAADLAARGIANASVQVGDAEALDFPAGSFDAVLAGFMIFFCPDPDRVLAEFARVLKPGGVVALTIFDGSTPSKVLRDVGEELFGAQDSRASEVFDRAEVLDPALVRAGFTQPEGTDVDRAVPLRRPPSRWSAGTAATSPGCCSTSSTTTSSRSTAQRLAEHLETMRSADGFEMVQRARVTVARKR